MPLHFRLDENAFKQQISWGVNEGYIWISLFIQYSCNDLITCSFSVIGHFYFPCNHNWLFLFDTAMYNSCPIETVSEIYFSFFKMDYVKLNIYVSCGCFQYPSSLPFVSVRCVAFLARCYMGSLESLNVCHTRYKQTVICILWNRNAMAWKAALLKDLHRSPLPASKHLQDRQADLRQMSTPVKCVCFRGNSMRANAVYAKVVWYVY